MNIKRPKISSVLEEIFIIEVAFEQWSKFKHSFLDAEKMRSERKEARNQELIRENDEFEGANNIE